ncbi:ABC transporter substrate-binding protein [Spirochaeta africana]|uniref:ABC-type sugar transport system, periplasmic component n=1 Tax=Spirochaeta africana (strain ATCC 700263 / DSM 8902 / Z-7692) TaxID=889378 RepID=H9UHP5_SPIAZ|nr:ABC transporter substrate-binding protein [Spirochaeta africana]AFG37038.1 ABC-type sugar transport system, periplasmic component [Spirochaeta africana DSM 8902]
MRKIMIVVLIAALPALVFAAGQRETDGVTTLTVNSYMSDEAPKLAFENLVADFESKNPDIRVEVNTTAHEQFKIVLPNWLTSRNAPDVVTWFAGYRMQAFAERGLLEPLNDAFAPGEFEDAFPEAFIRASSYDGDIYFLPQSWYWWAVYYNTEVFDELGLEVPETWDEFLAVSETLKQNGIAPIAIGARDTWTAGGWLGALNTMINGFDYHMDLTAGNIPYTDPGMQEVFETFAMLNERGYIMENATSYSWQEATTPLFNGEAGMYLMGQFLYDVAPDDVKPNLDFFRFPTMEAGQGYAVDTPTDGYMIPANARNKEAAMRFINYLATEESQAMFANELGRLAANQHVAPPDAQAEKGLEMVQGAIGAMQFYDRDAPEEMAARGMNAFIEAMENPNRIPQILRALDADRERIHAEDP